MHKHTHTLSLTLSLYLSISVSSPIMPYQLIWDAHTFFILQNSTRSHCWSKTSSMPMDTKDLSIKCTWDHFHSLLSTFFLLGKKSPIELFFKQNWASNRPRQIPLCCAFYYSDGTSCWSAFKPLQFPYQLFDTFYLMCSEEQAHWSNGIRTQLFVSHLSRDHMYSYAAGTDGWGLILTDNVGHKQYKNTLHQSIRQTSSRYMFYSQRN